MKTTDHSGKVTQNSTVGRAINELVAECAEKHGNKFERYPKPRKVWEALNPLFKGYCQDNEVKQKNACRFHYNKAVDNLFGLKGKDYGE